MRLLESSRRPLPGGEDVFEIEQIARAGERFDGQFVVSWQPPLGFRGQIEGGRGSVAGCGVGVGTAGRAGRLDDGELFGGFVATSAERFFAALLAFENLAPAGEPIDRPATRSAAAPLRRPNATRRIVARGTGRAVVPTRAACRCARCFSASTPSSGVMSPDSMSSCCRRPSSRSCSRQPCLRADEVGAGGECRERPCVAACCGAAVKLKRSERVEQSGPFLAAVVRNRFEAGVFGKSVEHQLGLLQRAAGFGPAAQSTIAIDDLQIGVERGGRVRKRRDRRLMGANRVVVASHGVQDRTAGEERVAQQRIARRRRPSLGDAGARAMRIVSSKRSKAARYSVSARCDELGSLGGQGIVRNLEFDPLARCGDAIRPHDSGLRSVSSSSG